MIGRELFYLLARFACRVFFLLGFRLRVFGFANLPERDGVVIASNHQSYFDPSMLSLGPTRHCSFMARSTLFDNRLLGAILRGLNTFPVRRGGMDKEALREADRRLKNGACLVLFPEGTRSRDGTIGPLLPGVLSIAERAGVPIVPAVVEGAFEAWPRHGRIRRRPISVWYGRPISVAERKGMSRAEFADVLRERMCLAQAKLKEMQARARR